MKHVIAFDISMGKSYMVIYNAQKQCVFEGNIKHSKSAFHILHDRIQKLKNGYGQFPQIVVRSNRNLF